MGIKHAFTSVKSDGTDSSLLQPSNWNADHTGGLASAMLEAKGDLVVATASGTAARLGIEDDGYVLTADSGETTGVKWAASASGFAIPPVTQKVAAYSESGTPHNVTVAVPTGATVLVVQSDSRHPTGITQTNVTWTSRYSGNSGTMYLSVWTGAISGGAAGTNVAIAFAASTKSNDIFIEIDCPELTAAGTANTSTTGGVLLSGEADGALCLYAETSFNGNTSFTVSTKPHIPVSWGGCVSAGVCYFSPTDLGVAIVQSGSATRFTALMRLS